MDESNTKNGNEKATSNKLKKKLEIQGVEAKHWEEREKEERKSVETMKNEL